MGNGRKKKQNVYMDIPGDVWWLLIMEYAFDTRDAVALWFTCKSAYYMVTPIQLRARREASYKIAAEEGNVMLFQEIMRRKGVTGIEYFRSGLESDTFHECMELAARNGRIEFLEWTRTWAVEMFNPFMIYAKKYRIAAAITKGHYEYLIWLTKLPVDPDSDDTQKVYRFKDALKGGNPDVIAWCRTQGAAPQARHFSAAAYGGALDVMREIVAMPGVRVEGYYIRDAMRNALRKGHINVLEAWEDMLGEEAMAQDVLRTIMDVIKETKHLEAFKWAYKVLELSTERGVISSGGIAGMMRHVADSGREDLMRFVVEHGKLSSWVSSGPYFLYALQQSMIKNKTNVADYLFGLSGAPQPKAVLWKEDLSVFMGPIVQMNAVNSVRWLLKRGVGFPEATWKHVRLPEMFKLVAFAKVWVGGSTKIREFAWKKARIAMYFDELWSGWEENKARHMIWWFRQYCQELGEPPKYTMELHGIAVLAKQIAMAGRQSTMGQGHWGARRGMGIYMG